MKQKIFISLLAFFIIIGCLFTFKVNTINAEVTNNDQASSCTIQSLRNCDRDGLIRILIELLLSLIENNQQLGPIPIEPVDEQENGTGEDLSFVDSRDGQGYSIVKIGNQTWMGENLRYLPSVSSPGSGSKYTPFYYVNGYTGTNVLEAQKTYNYNKYGVLYNYSAALTACPPGWHLPSDQEWYELEKYLSTGSCQYNRYGKWDCAPAGSILRESKLRVPMAASRDPNGTFYNLGANTSFWSSTRYLSDALYRKININENGIYRDPASLDYGFSVRCIKGYSNQDLIDVPSINIISPSKGELLDKGKKEYEIIWDSHNVDTVSFFLVKEGESDVAADIGEGIQADAGKYLWTIPEDNHDINLGGQFRIMIFKNDDFMPFAYSDWFEISNRTNKSSTPSINIISPKSTDTLIVGETYTIKWESGNLTGDVIQVNISGPSGKIVSYLPSTATSYDWTIPAGDYTTNNKVSISINSVGSNENEAYEAYDTVVVNVTEAPAPYINIISPKSTDTLIAGKTYTVKWESGNLTGNIIKILESGGRPVTYLPSTATSYNWTIPSDCVNNKANISIGSIASNGKYEALDVVIVNVTEDASPYINIISPKPNDTLIAGKTYTVKWESGNLTGDWILIYAGSNLVAGASISDNQALWTIPESYAGKNLDISVGSIKAGNWEVEGMVNVLIEKENVITPSIDYVSPASGTGRDTIKIYGKNLVHAIPDGATIQFLQNGEVVHSVGSKNIHSSDGSVITFQIDNNFLGMLGPGKYQIRVVNNYGKSNTVDFNITTEGTTESLPDLVIRDVNYYLDYYIAIEYCNYGKEQLKVAPEIKATNTKTGQSRIYTTSAPKPGECLGANNTGFQVSSIGLNYGEDAQVRVEIDPDNKIKESNENNNILIKSIRANESPYIERINPSQGRPGEKITIYGKYLFGYRPSGITIEWFREGISVGTTISPITESLDGRSLEFTLSKILFGNLGPGKYQIRVFNDVGSSNLLDFSVIE
ncbi:MAG: Uncharacterized protein XE08_0452 [Parcubacteria bacterium 32_520]|nr:MAG: Uncharacterized protein XE08_0452 [Parcubacteria bacterium 32_520]